MNRGDVKLIIDRCIAHDVPDAADLIERQAAQIEMLRKMLKQVCGSYLLEHPDTNIDPFVEALSTTQDQALEQFAAKANRFISRRG